MKVITIEKPIVVSYCKKIVSYNDKWEEVAIMLMCRAFCSSNTATYVSYSTQAWINNQWKT